MNRRMVLYVVGTVIKIEAALMLLPLITALIYKESCSSAILVSIGIALVTGFAMTLIFKPGSKVIYAKEGFVIVSLAWIVMSLIGALPFYISKEIPSFIDAFFETASGFTTTGASILTDVEAMSKGLLFWRSFTHWVGGMGVLVFVMAVIPSVSDRSIHILRAEAPGPVVGKIVPKMKQTARILYIIYIALTFIEFVFLFAGGMPLYDSIIHAVGTAGTGGFGIKADSLGSYSPYIQWVITVFMLLFGVNFNLYYFMLIRKFRSAIRNEELMTYGVIVLFSIVTICVNITPLYETVSESLRHAAFQVAAIISTTGFATTDFNLWPGYSKTLILLLMFIGGCAGSTAGGFKISRIVLLFKNIKRELQKLLHPRAVATIRLDGKRVDEKTISSLGAYLAIYALFMCVVVFLLGFDKFDLETNISVAASCVNNIGPGLGAAGPASSYALYSPFSKVILSFTMLLGRLEIFPLILTFSPSTWVKK
ncbi:MAG: TrkH family potassium uptake protein [Clostridia bacterium]|nr:TrkH family potassium uptake protein [Clostridia bacterium]MBO7319395.1 TrkH family potassium uptake protein [Clostridia bacterium]